MIEVLITSIINFPYEIVKILLNKLNSRSFISFYIKPDKF